MDMQEFREISRTQPWHKRPQKWWDLFSILGGCVSAVIWFLYSGVRSNVEGFDLISPILMIGIPVFMVTYRTQLDDMLIPLQPHRKKFPKLLLVGAGIAVRPGRRNDHPEPLGPEHAPPSRIPPIRSVRQSFFVLTAPGGPPMLASTSRTERSL